jgi:hypothetical protein
VGLATLRNDHGISARIGRAGPLEPGGALKIRRVAVVGVAVFALAGTVVGCATRNGTSAAATSTPSASPSPSPTPEPEDVLLASAKSLATASYKFTVQSDGLTGTGSADAARDVMHGTFTGRQQNVSVTMDIIIDFDVHMKMDVGPLNKSLGIPAGKYLHIDALKLGENSTLPVFPGRGPLDVAGLMASLVVRSTDGRSFSGTVDLTKATGDDTPNADLLQKAGDKAKSVPFTATLDDQGRMTHLKIDGSAIDPNLVVEATYSDFGKAADVTPPDSSQVVEAPDAVIKMFQSS